MNEVLEHFKIAVKDWDENRDEYYEKHHICPMDMLIECCTYYNTLINSDEAKIFIDIFKD